MFTGIITHTSQVTALRAGENGGVELSVESPFRENEPLTVGESIAINGCCLTVLPMSVDSATAMSFFVSAESLRKTALSKLSPGAAVNVERAMKIGERLGGHLVSGHVDGVGNITEAVSEEASHILRIQYPSQFNRLVIPKGSITVDGISLTVNDLIDTSERSEFTVNIIPHTYQNTNLARSAVGDSVNLEFDIVGKYLLRAEEVSTVQNTIIDERLVEGAP